MMGLFQVLELGIVVHSVIIGISLGASQSPATIKPLLVALSFHQFFEGMGLGGCISQVNSLLTLNYQLLLYLVNFDISIKRHYFSLNYNLLVCC